MTAIQSHADLLAEAEQFAAEVYAFDQTRSHDVIVETAGGRRNLSEQIVRAARLLSSCAAEVARLRAVVQQISETGCWLSGAGPLTTCMERGEPEPCTPCLALAALSAEGARE